MTLNILVTNDDGIFAPGIKALREVLAASYDVSVFAPDRDHSGASSSLTLSRPLRTHTFNDGSVSVQGTPTDCVHLAVTGLLDEWPDMVVSGINSGSNLGDDVWYSGTVAAAMEGRFLGLTSIAVSLVGNNPTHYATAARVAYDLVGRMRSQTLESSIILNVNVPDVPFEELAGHAVTRLGTRHCAAPIIRQKDPRGKEVYWIGPAGKIADAGPGTDFHAIENKKVSITPLRVDITAATVIPQLEEWLNKSGDNSEGD